MGFHVGKYTIMSHGSRHGLDQLTLVQFVAGFGPKLWRFFLVPFLGFDAQNVDLSCLGYISVYLYIVG